MKQRNERMPFENQDLISHFVDDDETLRNCRLVSRNVEKYLVHRIRNMRIPPGLVLIERMKRFTNLTSLSAIDMTPHRLIEIVSETPNLTRLEMDCGGDLTTVLPLVMKKAPKITDLALSNVGESVKILADSTTLRKLTLKTSTLTRIGLETSRLTSFALEGPLIQGKG